MSAEPCEICRELAILSGILENFSIIAGPAVADMLNHVLNGHTAESAAAKFGMWVKP